MAIAEPTTSQKPLAPLGQRLAAEAFGTFVLIFGVIGTALFTSQTAGIVAVALAAGIAVLSCVYAVGWISGGHFNPAVSIGAAAAGRIAWKDVLPYVVAQLVGGVIATVLLFVMATNRPSSAFSPAQKAEFASNGYGEHSPGGFGLLAVIIAEIVLTAVFVYVILGATDRRAPAGFAGLAIGLGLTLVHLVAIPISNASVNPARSFATAIFGGGDAFAQLWVFIAAPVVGALIAGYSYRPLFDRRA